MPRLIDADKYCEFLNTYPLEKAQDNIMTFYRDALQHTFECEVKAIPVEWLKAYASRKSANDGMDCYWHFWEEDVLKMIDEWEKENGRSE